MADPHSEHRLVGIRFQYVAGDAPHTFENLPFYIKTLRGFLEKHLGKVVWLMGALIEQPAFLLFLEDLKPQVYEMLSAELANGGSYKISPVKNPVELLRKYYLEQRVAIGWLKNGNLELGNPSSIMASPLGVNFRDGFWLNNYIFLKADDAYSKMHDGEPWICFVNAVELHCRDGAIAFVKQYPQLWIRESALPKYQRGPLDLDTHIIPSSEGPSV